MKCTQCQHENPAGWKFCGECGARLGGSCPRCGSLNLPAQKFCGECGAPLTAAEATKLAAPDAYTPTHLAEKILASRSAIEGERKQVTVLFCDVVQSTALAEQLGAEGCTRCSAASSRLALAEVHRYEGTINQFLGDGFMALFGAPLAHEDHARRAVLAALGLPARCATAAGRRAGRSGAGARSHRASTPAGRRGRHRRRPPDGLHRRRRHHAPGGPPAADAPSPAPS